jgi:hypothetical protein
VVYADKRKSDWRFSLMWTLLRAINSYTSENYALLQFNNSDHILELDGAPVHFSDITCD